LFYPQQHAVGSGGAGRRQRDTVAVAQRGGKVGGPAVYKHRLKGPMLLNSLNCCMAFIFTTTPDKRTQMSKTTRALHPDIFEQPAKKTFSTAW
jgi:hypothetical protein